MDRPQQLPSSSSSDFERPLPSSKQSKPARKRLTPTLVPSSSSSSSSFSSSVFVTGTTSANPTPSYNVSSNDAISLRFISKPEDIQEDIKESVKAPDSFHPVYTHQIFGDAQRIYGYNGLHAEMLFTCGSMRAFVRSAWDERRADGACDTNPAVTLSRKLPDALPCTSLEEFRETVVAESAIGQTAFVPPGKLVYNEPCADDANCSYEMYFDDISDGNPDGRGRLLNKRCQISVLFFIDGSSYIKTNELGWRGFFLFKHDKRTNHYTLLGFCTAYEFWHAPQSIRFRISQILVFPPYQRHGHGMRFVDAIYRFARENDHVYDVTIEDPDDDFQIVRDLCELRSLKTRGYFTEFQTVLPREVFNKIHDELKICGIQIIRCWFVCMYMLAVADGTEDIMRQYRLTLKAHLSGQFSDWLQDCPTPEERKKVLQEIYEEHIEDWKLLAAALPATMKPKPQSQ